MRDCANVQTLEQRMMNATVPSFGRLFFGPLSGRADYYLLFTDLDYLIPMYRADIAWTKTQFFEPAACSAKQRRDGPCLRRDTVFRVAIGTQFKHSAILPAVLVLDLSQ